LAQGRPLRGLGGGAPALCWATVAAVGPRAYTNTYIHIYIYIYMYTESEGKRDIYMFVYTYLYPHIHVCIKGHQ